MMPDALELAEQNNEVEKTFPEKIVTESMPGLLIPEEECKDAVE